LIVQDDGAQHGGKEQACVRRKILIKNAARRSENEFRAAE